MAWSRLDDGLDEHVKVEALLDEDELRGLAAVGLWTLTLANSARRLTDGNVSTRTLKKLAPRHGQALAELLSEVGMYEVDGGYRIHDYLHFNPSRAETEEKRRRDSERKQAGRSDRNPRGIPPDSNGTSTRNPNGQASDVHAESARPVPVPGPVPKEGDTNVVSVPGPLGSSNVVDIARSTSSEKAA